jgi:hypothetical protein
MAPKAYGKEREDMTKYRDVAHLVGYDVQGGIVYEEVLPIDEYYDGEHEWDTTEGVLGLSLALLKGKLHASDGHVFQEFETAFSETEGKYVGSKAIHDVGTVQRDGIYENEG